MIEYRKGDLVQAALNREIDILAHGCNCFNTMGSGIAKQIVKEFPCVREADTMTKKGDKSKLGNLTYSRCGSLTLFNLYTQYAYGKGGIYVDYGAVTSSINLMKEKINSLYWDRSKIKIGIPKIGCGLAGGDWLKVESIIVNNLSNYKVYVFEL